MTKSEGSQNDRMMIEQPALFLYLGFAIREFVIRHSDSPFVGSLDPNARHSILS